MTARSDQGDSARYPYRDGDFIVLGPEIFASGDGSVICWQGVNYVRQDKAADASTWPTAQAWLDWLRDPQAASDEGRNGIHATPDQRSQPAHTNKDRCPDCRTPAGARHYCDKAPAFFIPEAKLASDEDRDGR